MIYMLLYYLLCLMQMWFDVVLQLEHVDEMWISDPVKACGYLSAEGHYCYLQNRTAPCPPVFCYRNYLIITS
jgi:hypothetical protein